MQAKKKRRKMCCHADMLLSSVFTRVMRNPVRQGQSRRAVQRPRWLHVALCGREVQGLQAVSLVSDGGGPQEAQRRDRQSHQGADESRASVLFGFVTHLCWASQASKKLVLTAPGQGFSVCSTRLV